MGKGILVAGAARSGTSALAGALGACDVELGSDLKPANRHNPKGYFERAEILALHDECLGAFDSTWDSLNFLPDRWRESEAADRAREKIGRVFQAQFSRADVWAVKDARLSRLAPLWQEALPGEQLSVIIPLRHPFEVANSLARFMGKSWTAGLVYWIFQAFDVERSTRGMNRIFTTYTELLSEPAALLGRIERQLGVTLPGPAAERSTRLKSWIEPGLRRFCHQETGPAEPGVEPLRALADLVYRRFAEENLAAEPARVDALFEHCFGTAYFGYAEMTKNQRALEREKKDLQERLKSAEDWMKGPWLRRAFHRWEDPAHPRVKTGLWLRLNHSVRRRLGSPTPEAESKENGAFPLARPTRTF